MEEEDEKQGDIIEFLPLDVISCILVWLPIPSLLRFKSVCKSWLSIIESPDFVDAHIQISSGDQKLDLLVLTSPYTFDKPQQILLLSTFNSNEVSLDFPDIGSHYQVNPAKLVAHCKGVICLRQHRRVCLWNPATKQCTHLAPLPVLPREYHDSVGFGFDPKANDYKLVTIYLLDNSDRDTGFVFHIYSVSSNLWRKFEGFVPPNLTLLSNGTTLYRDTMYCWLALAYDKNRHIVYMFDFSDKVFTCIPTPSSLFVHTLFTITENLACAGQLTNEVDDVRSTNYEIWMLSDYQVKESWTKLYSINLDQRPTYDMIEWMMTWVSDEDANILLYLRGKQLGMYDLVAQQVTNLPFLAASSGPFEVIKYRKSMLSIKRGNGAAHGLPSMDSNRRTLITPSITQNNDECGFDVHKGVINRILLWLPAFSLQRFKSVCKSWYSLIQSSDFIAQHLSLHHYQHLQENVGLILHSEDMFEDSPHHSPNASNTCLLSFDKLELLDFPSWVYFSVAASFNATSFNGIICWGDRKYADCCLWNPVTKQFRDLCPNFPNDPETYHLGFGFDIKTNDYKLVRFFEGDDSVVQIYCLSTDSWRTISDDVLPTLRWISGDLGASYRDGIYCWLVDMDSYWVILSFDFGNEVFRTIPLPDIVTRWSSIAVLRDKIVCISLGESYDYYPEDANSWNCEIWMMDEYGVTESWSKLCMVGPFSNDWRFKKCYSKKSGDYMLLLKDGQLYEYNLVTQERERLPQIHGPKDYGVVAYEPSLVPIKQ